jgi:hypothetical protein
MRVYQERVTVEPASGMPRTIYWRDTSYRVATMLDFWVAEGKWWSGGERRNYLLLITDRGTLEIFSADDRWYLSRVVYD